VAALAPADAGVRGPVPAMSARSAAPREHPCDRSHDRQLLFPFTLLTELPRCVVSAYGLSRHSRCGYAS